MDISGYMQHIGGRNMQPPGCTPRTDHPKVEGWVIGTEMPCNVKGRTWGNREPVGMENHEDHVLENECG